MAKLALISIKEKEVWLEVEVEVEAKVVDLNGGLVVSPA